MLYFYFRNFPKNSENPSNMPASKKMMRAQQQKKNVAAGVGDAKGRVASKEKAVHVMVPCSICRVECRMIKENKQASIHVTSKHPGKTFEECFPGYKAGL